MPEYLLQHTETPPSMNTKASGFGANHHQAARVKKEWEGKCGFMLMEAKVPRHLASVRASAVLRFPQKRRRDEGNFRMLLEKALGDALVAGGWLNDDTPDAYTFSQLEFDPETGPRRTSITLEVEPTGERRLDSNQEG